jgi:2-keto-4-pentenoate hydratase/2-oxohepta-3-ene-1,7-dioic acid hydratase in catechol pathway
MRIGRFIGTDGRPHWGVIVDGRRAREVEGTIPGAFTESTREIGIDRLLAPLAPPNIFAIGRNYKAHAEELGNAAPEKPLVFMKATTSVSDPDGVIEIPESAPDEVDFEGELAIVIGRAARRVSESAALENVFGYTCANDVSARDCQRSDKQFTRAKSFDTFCPLGPWIVTTDQIDPRNCRIRTRVNGQTMQDASTSSMIHSCAAIVSYLSHQFTLLPGTLILTGTPEGVGAGRKPPVFLKDGDRVEVEIDGIGVLASRVVRAKS